MCIRDRDWVYQIFSDNYINTKPVFHVDECHFKQGDGITAVSYTHLYFMGKSLYIAEKPSVAQEFAKALKLKLNRKDGY